MAGAKGKVVKIAAAGAIKYGPKAVGVVKKAAKNPQVRALAGKVAKEVAENPRLRKQAIQGAGKVARGAAVAAKGAGVIAVGKAGIAAARAKDKGAKVGDAAKQRMADAKEKRQEKKAEAAKAEQAMAVIGAAIKMTAAEFDEVYASLGPSVNPLETPGCYVVYLLSKPFKPGKGGFRYDVVYVGASDNMAEAVRRHFEGKGNVDLYADHRHKRNLQYLAFLPGCSDKRGDLMGLLGSDDSYNAYDW